MNPLVTENISQHKILFRQPLLYLAWLSIDAVVAKKGCCRLLDHFSSASLTSKNKPQKYTSLQLCHVPMQREPHSLCVLICEQVFTEAWLFQALETQRYMNKMIQPYHWGHSLKCRQEVIQSCKCPTGRVEATLNCGNKAIPYHGLFTCAKEEMLNK